MRLRLEVFVLSYKKVIYLADYLAWDAVAGTVPPDLAGNRTWIVTFNESTTSGELANYCKSVRVSLICLIYEWEYIGGSN
jgi:hypothetical protein